MCGHGISRSVRLFAAGAVFAAGGVAVLVACGPFLTDLVTVTTVDPPDAQRFARGDVGVVRPHFRRRNLLQAYRLLSGRSVLRERATESDASLAKPPVDAWFEIAGRRPSGFSQNRPIGNYQSILNCSDDALALAVRTFRVREARFGVRSPELRDWLEGQRAVFSNCGGEPLTVPAVASATVNSLIRADRAYQTAAAYFYAGSYDEAEKRFRAIAVDAQSPWRPYGRFLAARSIIRGVTTRDAPPPATVLNWDQESLSRFRTAERDLQAALADSAAAPLHASARRLLAFLACRTRPIERLHELTAMLTRDQTVGPQDLKDYVWLMDHLVGDTVAFHLSAVDRRRIAGGDDFTSWVLTMQDTAPDLDAALAAWRAQRSAAWLVALLWRVAADHPAASELLEAARGLDSKSPAYPSVSFLRVRLLTNQGRFEEARAVLATLPEGTDGTTSPETLNLYKAQRLRLSQSLDEFLRNAPRDFVVPVKETWRGGPLLPQPVFDEDAASMLTLRMPLEMLVAAAESPQLPRRLRTRVASVAFVRAVVLQDDAPGVRAAATLASLVERLRVDLRRYIDATDAVTRHRAGLMVILRSAGLHMDVHGLDDDHTIAVAEPHREFDHMFRDNWWCPPRAGGRDIFRRPSSELIRLVYGEDARASDVAFPPFVTDEQRGRVETEQANLVSAGSGRAYLATEALAWAQSEPHNPELAEALARVVEGWRWGCGYEDKWPLAQRAFQALHRNFPRSDWAKRTPYWYRG